MKVRHIGHPVFKLGRTPYRVIEISFSRPQKVELLDGSGFVVATAVKVIQFPGEGNWAVHLLKSEGNWFRARVYILNPALISSVRFVLKNRKLWVFRVKKEVMPR